MQTNSNTTPPATNGRVKFARFALGQTFITPGAQEALQIAGQTELEFLRRHMSGDWGSELSEEDIQENELSLKKGFRLLSAYRTGKGQKLYVMWNKDLISWLDARRLGFWFGSSSYYLSSSRGCGNCGKLDVLCRVFQALWERWENAVCFSTVSIARQFPQPFL
jgi:hypothetical protein